MSDSKYTGCISIIDQDGNIAFERDLGSDEVIAELLARINFFQKPPELGEGIVVGPHNVAAVFKSVKKQIEDLGPRSDKVIKNGKVKSSAGGGNREQIIELINQGLKAGEIAKKLKTSIETVYTTKSQAKKAGLLGPVSKSQERRIAVQEEESPVFGSDPDKKEVVLEALRGGATIEEAAKEAQMRPKVVKMIKYMAEKKGEVFPGE